MKQGIKLILKCTVERGPGKLEVGDCAFVFGVIIFFM